MSEAISKLVSGHTENPTADVGHDKSFPDAGAGEELAPDLDIGVLNLRCRNGICGGAWVEVVRAPAGWGEGVDCQWRCVEVLKFPLFWPVNPFLKLGN